MLGYVRTSTNLHDDNNQTIDTRLPGPCAKDQLPNIPFALVLRLVIRVSFASCCRRLASQWAGLGAALHLSKVGLYDVTLLEAGKAVGGLVAGFEDETGKPSEIGM